MKKTLILTSVVLLIAASAFAGASDRLFVQPNATASATTTTLASANVAGTAYATGLLTGPSTTNNDDSCDISLLPAATLLIPYFEVDFNNASTDARNTIFSITNTTPQPQIAHVTIWTDWSFPVIDFNLWLTGYDVVPVNLYDIIRNGNIPPTGSETSPEPDADSDINEGFDDDGNPNHYTPAAGTLASSCETLPGPIHPDLRAAIQTALTTGEYDLITPGGTACDEQVGGENDIAVGYITIDVVAFCSQQLPTDETFYEDAILWDNALIGDYVILNASDVDGNWAGGTPMVHIRAVPEGGPEENDVLGTPDFGTRADAVATGSNFPYTFYDRYTPGGFEDADRRQPLPGTFAARFIEGGALDMATDLIIWREGFTRGNHDCTEDVWADNAALPADLLVRFDESENANIVQPECEVSPCLGVEDFLFEETQRVSTADTTFFPPDFTGTDDAGGWMYLDLNGAQDPADRPELTSQNWVVISQTAEGRYGVLYDAAALGNGCSPAPSTQEYDGEYMIRPAPNVTP